MRNRGRVNMVDVAVTYLLYLQDLGFIKSYAPVYGRRDRAEKKRYCSIT